MREVEQAVHGRRDAVPAPRAAARVRAVRPGRRDAARRAGPGPRRRFERLYGYLNDDVTRRRATIGLALELGAARPTASAARRRLAAGAPLLHQLLVTVEDPERPFLSRGLRVPDRVTAHLLGGETRTRR